MSLHNPSLVEVVRGMIANAQAAMHTCFVGEVVSYNEGQGLASIQPAIYLVNHLTGVAQPRAIVPNVPVLFPQGSGGIGIRWELQPGDKCFCVVNERSIDRWINDGLCADPQVNRKFDMTDGLCIPFATGSNSPQTDGIFIASDGTVTVGSGTTGPVAQASKVEAQLQTILDAITNATTVPQDGGAAFKTAILVSLNGAGFPGSVASSNLESED